MGHWKPKREVMYVDDLASAIFFILDKKIGNNKKLLNILKKTALINVGSGKEYTIKEIAEKICKVEKNKIKLKFNTHYPDGTKRKVVDIRLLKKLGWLTSEVMFDSLVY